MALFVRQSEDRSKYQEQIAAELQEKARKRALEESQSGDIEDSAYLKDTKSTTSLAWVWVVIVLVALTLLVIIILQTTK